MKRAKLEELLDDVMKETVELDKKDRNRLIDATIQMLTEETDVTLDDEEDEEEDAAPED